MPKAYLNEVAKAKAKAKTATKTCVRHVIPSQRGRETERGWGAASERERKKSQAHFYAHLQFAIFRLKSARITELPACQPC